jgi:alanyl-tRNA synthetase
MGDTGPCGPNSEIYWDFYPERGENGETPANDEDRFFEIWNLVFMQFDQPGDGSLVPLAKPGVDTGMGLERMSVVMQGVHSNYETDLFAPILNRIQELTGHTDVEREQQIVSYRVIADHGRATTFLLSEGVTPGNEWRSYVLRRVMRRAMVHGRKLGLTDPFLGEIAKTVMQIMGDIYPEIVQKREFILTNILQEEKLFGETLMSGSNRFDRIVSDLHLQPGDTLPGREMFTLYDTFGLSKDIVYDMAVARGLEVDMEGFEQALEEQRTRSREGGNFVAKNREANDIYQSVSPQPTEFLGYDYKYLTDDGSGQDEHEAVMSKVLGVILDKEVVQSAGQGQQVEVVLDRTPFYAESGGQVGDKGYLIWDGGRMEVQDTRKPVGGIIVHRGVVLEGTLRSGQEVEPVVPGSVRWDTMRNHTATHLVHKALRDVLGTHVHQAGSVVEPGRLRFDFHHSQPLTHDELTRVEQIVNDQVRADYPVVTREMDYQSALSEGTMALFGEKYGAVVRQVRIPGFESKELCGGTHVTRTGQIGAFFISYEGSVGSGLRRIEAVTGAGAVAYAQERPDRLNEVAGKLHTTPEHGTDAVASLQDQVKEAHKRIEALERQIARGETGSLTQQVQTVDGVQVLTGKANVGSIETLRETGDHLRDKLGSGVIVLGAVIDGEPKLVAMVTQDVIDRGISAGEIIGKIAPSIGGKGGGQPNMAGGGGKDPAGLDNALAMVRDLVATKLGSTVDAKAG